MANLITDKEAEEKIAEIEKKVAMLLREIEIEQMKKAEIRFQQRQFRTSFSEAEQAISKNKLKSPDAIEMILQDKGMAMAASDITDALRQLGFYDIDKQAVTSTLVRHHHKGKRFVRVAPNVFDLIDRVKKQAK